MESMKMHNYKVNEPNSLRVLATCLMKPPDQQANECLHEHVRGIQRKRRTLIVSGVARTLAYFPINCTRGRGKTGPMLRLNLSRTRCCIDSKILEKRKVPTKHVTKEHYIANYKNVKKTHLKAMFRPDPKKRLQKRWSLIMGKTDWSSTTPESFQWGLAARAWAR